MLSYKKLNTLLAQVIVFTLFVSTNSVFAEEYEHKNSHCGVDSIVSKNKKIDIKSKLKDSSKAALVFGDVSPSQQEYEVATIIVSINGEQPRYKEAVLNYKLIKGSENITDYFQYATRGNTKINFDANRNGAVDTFVGTNIDVGDDFCFGVDYYAKDIIRQISEKQAGDRIAQIEGFKDINDYDIYLFIIPRVDCPWSGIANLNCAIEPNDKTCFSFVNTYTDFSLYAHELGHTLGLNHSNSEFEKRPGKSAFTPYGDYSCTMGMSFGYHLTNFNTVQQALGGWLSQNEFVDIASEGKYTLSSSDLYPGRSVHPILASWKKDGDSENELYLGYSTFSAPYNQISDSFDKKLSIYNSSGDVIDRLALGQSFFTLSENGEAYHEVKVTRATDTKVDFQIISNPYSTKDDDGDLISNAEELFLGSNPNDSGSYYYGMQNSGSKVLKYVLWNSYLNTFNYIELSNPDFLLNIDVDVTLFTNDGREHKSKSFRIPPLGQIDVAVNELNGFVKDAYGLIKIESSLELEGRSSFYKMDTSFKNFEFAYSLNFERPVSNESLVRFNTEQPSVTLGEKELPVLNWLSIVNHSERTSRFRVISYNEEGQELNKQEVSLAPFARKDLDGGHGFAGANAKGFHRIEPLDSDVLYTAQLTRYGQGGTAGEILFAFPQYSVVPNGEVQYLNLSKVLNEDTRIELINASSSPQDIEVNFYDNKGSLIDNKTYPLNAYAQAELELSRIFYVRGTQKVFGLAEIKPAENSAVVAQVTKYFKGAATAGMRALYSSSASEVFGAGLTGSYNLFLNMENRLRMVNTSDDAVNYLLYLSTPYGPSAMYGTLEAKAARTIPFHNTSFFSLGPIKDTYGSVRILADSYGSLKTEMVRIRKFTHPRSFAEEIELAFPTDLN